MEKCPHILDCVQNDLCNCEKKEVESARDSCISGKRQIFKENSSDSDTFTIEPSCIQAGDTQLLETAK